MQHTLFSISLTFGFVQLRCLSCMLVFILCPNFTGCMIHVFTNDAFQQPFSLLCHNCSSRSLEQANSGKPPQSLYFWEKYIHMNEAFHVFGRSLLLLYKNHLLYKQAFQFVLKLAVQTYILKRSTVMSVIIRTIQLLEHPPFSRKID